MTQGIVNRFQGSKLEVQTGVGTSKTITGITKTNPAIVAASAHGFVANDVVQLLHVDGMTEVDNEYFAVGTPVASGTFALLDTDATGYDAFVADSPSLAAAAPVIFSQFCELTGLQKQGAAANQVEVSTICSVVKEFVQGLADTGTAQLDYHWALSSAVQQAISAAERSGNVTAIRLTDPSGGVFICMGTVQQTSFTGTVDGVWTGTATFKLSGLPFEIPAAV